MNCLAIKVKVYEVDFISSSNESHAAQKNLMPSLSSTAIACTKFAFASF